MPGEVVSSAASSTWDNLFSPTVLFFLLNLMVAFIAISAKLRSNRSSASSNHETDEQDHPYPHQREVEEEHHPSNPSSYSELPREPPYRSPSTSGRFNSFDHRSSMPDIEEEEGEGEEEEGEGEEEEGEGEESAEPAQLQETQHEQETEDNDDDQSYEEIYRNIKADESRRNRHAREAPPRMRRSWSMSSDFGRYHRGEGSGGGGEGEDVEEVERRRPASARARREVDEGVDARADDFINRFKQQLLLQRLESFSRYRAMIGLGGRK